MFAVVTVRVGQVEIVDGAEVAAMVSAFQEGRPMPTYTPAASHSGTPNSGVTVPREKPKTAEEEAPGPGLVSPKPSLA